MGNNPHTGPECEGESEEELQEPGSKERQPAEAEAEVDASAETQRKETATGVEKGMVLTAQDIQYQDRVEAIIDVGQATKKGTGRPRKEEAMDVKKLEEPIPPDPSKGSVTDKGTKMCMDSGGNSAILNVGGKGGPGPPRRGRSQQLVLDSGDG
jgi:hypothetical protein